MFLTRTALAVSPSPGWNRHRGPPRPGGCNGDDATFDIESTGPGQVLESLSQTLGGIPRVLLSDTLPDDRGVTVVMPSSTEMPPPDDRGARYRLFGEIARGGMGAILKGRDPDLGRDLAVKVLLDQHRDKPDLIRREAKAQRERDRAVADRRATRLTATLSMVLMASVIGGAWAWNAYDRAARARTVAANFEEASREALQLQAEAHKAPPDGVAPWSLALVAAERAKDVVGPAGDPNLWQRALVMIDRIRTGQRQSELEANEAAKDKAMLDLLENIRGSGDEDEGGMFVETAYNVAFHDYGIDSGTSSSAMRPRPAVPHWNSDPAKPTSSSCSPARRSTCGSSMRLPRASRVWDYRAATTPRSRTWPLTTNSRTSPRRPFASPASCFTGIPTTLGTPICSHAAGGLSANSRNRWR
jgi:hypothetical protein